MADITRNVQDVRPNNYVKPGVQSPSPLSLAAELGGQAINLDAQLSRERLQKDAEALRTTYETSAPGAQAVQEGLNSHDQAQVDGLKGQLGAYDAAVQQGKMSFDEYRVRGERLLRQAISKRPGLASEFRGVAAQSLGVDVVGASVDVLASWERQQLQALASASDSDKGGPDFKRMRDDLDAAGVPSGAYTDEQTLTAWMQNQEAIRSMKVQNAEEEVVTTAVGTMQGGQTLRRPAATAGFITEVRKNKNEVFKSFSRGYAAIKTGQVTPAQMSTILTNGAMDVSGRVSVLRTAMAAGDVDPATAEKEIAGLESLAASMTEYASGRLDASLMKTKIDGLMLFMQNYMHDQDGVTEMAAARELFGDELLTMYVGPAGSFAKTGANAVGNTLLNVGSPISRASNAGTTVANVISTTLDRGGAQSNPAMIDSMNQVLVNAGTSFIELSPKELKSDHLTGPQGYITNLWHQRDGLKKALSDQGKQELMGAVSLAGLTNYHALAIDFGSRYGGIAKKMVYEIDPVSGDFLHPKPGVTLTGPEKAAVQGYNKAFGGKKILELYQTVLGINANEARELFKSGNSQYNQAKAEVKKTQAPAASAGGGSWWESL